MVTIEKLTIEERHTWGTCPVCFAQPGESCHIVCPAGDCPICGAPDKEACQNKVIGTCVARLVNAPRTAAINAADD